MSSQWSAWHLSLAYAAAGRMQFPVNYTDKIWLFKLVSHLIHHSISEVKGEIRSVFLSSVQPHIKTTNERHQAKETSSLSCLRNY